MKAPGEQQTVGVEPELAPAPDAALPHPALGNALNADSVLALQRVAGNAAVAGKLADPSDDRPLLRAIARSAHERTGLEAPAYRSPALLLRSQLRSRALARRVTTSGGDWDTDNYDDKIDIDNNDSKAPAADGWRGLDITLRFKPNATVDAELIGMTQTAQTVSGSGPLYASKQVEDRSIKSGVAEPLSTAGPAGETDEGAHIDQLSAYNNPIYPVATKTSKSIDDPNTLAAWGGHGYHYTDASKTLKQRDAKLIDKPRLKSAQKDSRQIFETTAVATKGAQAGTYYGSVRWGWRTDAGGTFTKAPLSKVTDGVPSSTFLKSAELWNAGKSSTGAANIKLDVPDVKVTKGPVTLRPPPMVDIALPVGTRLTIVTEFVAPLLAGTVKVVDGPHTGVTGDVDGSEWSNIADERA